jgi:hypothetical protein
MQVHSFGYGLFQVRELLLSDHVSHPVQRQADCDVRKGRRLAFQVLQGLIGRQQTLALLGVALRH